MPWEALKKNIEVQKLSLVHNFVTPADIEFIDNFKNPSWNSGVTDFSIGGTLFAGIQRTQS